MPRKKIKLKPKSQRKGSFYGKVVDPVEKARGGATGMIGNLKKKPSSRAGQYKPLDRFWPDI